MKFLALFIIALAVVGGAAMPTMALAQDPPNRNLPTPGNPPARNLPTPTNPPANDTPTSEGSRELTNPLSGIDSLEDLLVALLRVVVVLATPIVVLFIILAGFKYVTARGDVGKTKEATVALTYAIIGGVLIIGAVAIAEIIGNLVEAFSS